VRTWEPEPRASTDRNVGRGPGPHFSGTHLEPGAQTRVGCDEVDRADAVTPGEGDHAFGVDGWRDDGQAHETEVLLGTDHEIERTEASEVAGHVLGGYADRARSSRI